MWEVEWWEFLMNKMILWVKYLTQRKLSESLNDKENTWVWLCCQRGPLHPRSRHDRGWGCHLVCLLTDHLYRSPPPPLPPPRNYLSLPSISTPTILSLQSHHSTCSSSQIPPSGPSWRISSVLCLCNLFYGHFLVIFFAIEWFVAMVPQVAPAIPCGAADLALPFVQCWYWHLNLGALLPEKHIADCDFRA